MIKIDSYFFQCENFEPVFNEIGNTDRSINGTLHTDYVVKYYTFNIELEVNETSLGHLLYLLNKNRGGTNLTLVDSKNDQYIVDIPINGFKFNQLRGDGNYYKVNLTLEEVIN